MMLVLTFLIMLNMTFLMFSNYPTSLLTSPKSKHSPKSIRDKYNKIDYISKVLTQPLFVWPVCIRKW